MLRYARRRKKKHTHTQTQTCAHTQAFYYPLISFFYKFLYLSLLYIIMPPLVHSLPNHHRAVCVPGDSFQKSPPPAISKNYSNNNNSDSINHNNPSSQHNHSANTPSPSIINNTINSNNYYNPSRHPQSPIQP